jgi:hypothetical protein
LYDGPNRKPGDKPSYMVAVACPGCPATFTLRDLGLRSYSALMGDEPSKRSGVAPPGGQENHQCRYAAGTGALDGL